MTRAERAVEAIRLREQGLTGREIAAILGVSRSYAAALYNDPDGTKDRVRKANNGGKCQVCGKRTDGSNGRAKAPEFCVEHHPAFALAPCGTRSAYIRGCRCDECRAATRDYQRVLRRTKPAPHHGTESGYSNYYCRCDDCKRAGAEANRRYRERAKAAA